MKVYFADTSYFIALLAPLDHAHASAVRLAADPELAPITTDYVLLELAAFFAKPPLRAKLIGFITGLPRYANVRVVRGDQSLFDRGWQSYVSHGDKGWSLVDCISFLVMQDNAITTALTTDHHFEQAGFTALLKP